jgi:hypothetical protein
VLDDEHALRNDEYDTTHGTPHGAARDVRVPQHVDSSLSGG